MEFIIIKSADLQITKHPDSNIWIKDGDSVTLSVVAFGAEEYEWKRDDKVITGPKYHGTNGPILTINGFSAADQGEYSCIVKNSERSLESKPANMALGIGYAQVIFVCYM